MRIVSEVEFKKNSPLSWRLHSPFLKKSLTFVNISGVTFCSKFLTCVMKSVISEPSMLPYWKHGVTFEKLTCLRVLKDRLFSFRNSSIILELKWPLSERFENNWCSFQNPDSSVEITRNDSESSNGLQVHANG